MISEIATPISFIQESPMVMVNISTPIDIILEDIIQESPRINWFLFAMVILLIATISLMIVGSPVWLLIATLMVISIVVYAIRKPLIYGVQRCTVALPK